MSDEHQATDETAHERPAGPIPAAGFLGRVISAGGLIFAIGIVVAMLILIQEVVLRYFFNSPTNWAHETTIFLSGIAFVYGGLYCVARDSHIRVVLIYDAIPERWRRALDIAISAVCCIASVMFAYAAWLMVQRAAFTPTGEFRLETSGSAWNPVYPGLMKVFLLAVLTVMAVQFLILTINYARGKR